MRFATDVTIANGKALMCRFRCSVLPAWAVGRAGRVYFAKLGDQLRFPVSYTRISQTQHSRTRLPLKNTLKFSDSLYYALALRRLFLCPNAIQDKTSVPEWEIRVLSVDNNSYKSR